MSTILRPDFDVMYRSQETAEGSPSLTPWDIGGPQPVVQELVAYGALRGEVLDPGTGPGHHAIHYASKGYSTTGIDASPAAIERAKRNADRAGVAVNFEVADATKLDGLEGRFDTVVDSAFYHVFQDDEETQRQYAQALHRATKPGARLFMFEFGLHSVNGLHWPGLPADNFKRVLSASGWRIDYLGTSTYLGTFSSEMLAALPEVNSNPKWGEAIRNTQDQIEAIDPLVEGHRLYLPVWAVHASRID